MRKTENDIHRIQQRLTDALMTPKDGKVEIRQEDAVDIVFLLDIIRATKLKMDEVMK